MTPSDTEAEGTNITLSALVRVVADRAANRRTHQRKICLFLGAGADIASGGMSFSQLKRQAIEEFAKRPIFDVTDVQTIDEQFDKLFSTLAPDERALLVEALFRQLSPLRPSDAYKLLVLLAESGGIDAIVTTNFDGMLELAQQELGRDIIQVYAPGIARPYLMPAKGFSATRVPYLKLHGDISSRALTLLTAADLESAAYDQSMLDLLQDILSTHDLIIAGYAGNDRILAHLIGAFVREAQTRIFWCGPSELSRAAPLARLLETRARQIRINFDDLISVLARPVLERPNLAVVQPTYLKCLFDWRVEYGNREYLNAYATRAGHSIAELFARRDSIEAHLGSFLQGHRRLAIVAGPSGFGKTTIGVRLHRTWNGHRSTRVFLVRSRTLPASGDIEQFVSEQLGGLGSRAPFSLFQLERWSAENDLRVVLFIDGLNEFSPDIDRCVQLFRSILRFCYFLPESDSALRLIVTIRQETWRAMLPHIDLTMLRKVLWSIDELDQSIHTIPCNEFTADELSDAISRARSAGYASIDLDTKNFALSEDVRDPYIFGMISDAVHRGAPAVLGADLYRKSFDERLAGRGTYVDKVTIQDSLCSAALGCLASGEDRFREIDVQPTALRGEIIRTMKDLRILVDADFGFLRFDHDRTLEYFLALGLASSTRPSLETIDDLHQYLRHFSSQSKAIAAARLHYQLAPAARFSVITHTLRLLDAQGGQFSPSDSEALFTFGRDVLFEMAEQNEPIASRFLQDAIRTARSGGLGQHQERVVVQCAAGLSDSVAIPLLTQAAHSASSLARTEAATYATDRLVERYLADIESAHVELAYTAPYGVYFAEAGISGWDRLGRLLGFAAELGPDNTHPEEYAQISQSLHALLDLILEEPTWGEEAIAKLCSYLLAGADRLLFNATTKGIERFFSNSKRSAFAALIERLSNGAVLTTSDWQGITHYCRSLEYDIEYHLCHAVLVLSSLNDRDATFQIVEDQIKKLTSASSPVEVDFLHSALVYLHIVHAVSYDEGRFAPYEERILRGWPETLLFRPGIERGERRGFADAFDRNFEDGFAVIFPYGILKPGLKRRQYRYGAYRKAIDSGLTSPLPLYSKFLEEFLRSGRIEEAIQLLQTFAMVITAWPMEGLLALRNVIGHEEPRVRRATLRVLAEAYGRHPKETMRFLRTSGVAINDDDLLEIRIRRDARIGRRQVSEEQWARTAHFLLSRRGAKSTLNSSLQALVAATSPTDAIHRILEILGLCGI